MQRIDNIENEDYKAVAPHLKQWASYIMTMKMRPNYKFTI